MLFSTSLNILGRVWTIRKKEEKKKKQKRYVKCQWKESGRLPDWHLNCNDLAGNLRLIKYWTRLDWWSGSIIITTQRQDLQEDSPWGPKKAQTHPQKRHLRISTEALPIPPWWAETTAPPQAALPRQLEGSFGTANVERMGAGWHFQREFGVMKSEKNKY